MKVKLFCAAAAVTTVMFLLSTPLAAQWLDFKTHLARATEQPVSAEYCSRPQARRDSAMGAGAVPATRLRSGSGQSARALPA
jgi:hypothetical protein